MKNKLKAIFILVLIIFIIIILKENHQIFFKKLINIQRKMIPLISKSFKNKDNYFYDFGILFLYGFIHSLGPGHGKFIISSFTLIDKLTIKKVMIIAFIISYLQGFSALLFYNIFVFFGRNLIPQLSFQLENKTKGIMFMIIILLILVILYNQTRKIKINFNKKNLKNIYLISFLIGIIPCSGVLNILIFLKILKLDNFSFVSVLSICSGMFLTLFLSGIFSNFITNNFKNNIKISYIKYLRYFGFLFIAIYTVIIVLNILK